MHTSARTIRPQLLRTCRLNARSARAASSASGGKSSSTTSSAGRTSYTCGGTSWGDDGTGHGLRGAAQAQSEPGDISMHTLGFVYAVASMHSG